MFNLDDYISIVGENEISELRLISEKLRGKSIVNINSTSTGGGVAEILNRMVPLLKEMGVNARWECIKGGEKFFIITKKFHNALHGKKEQLSKEDFELYLDTVRDNVLSLSLDADILFIHDPQPAALVLERNKYKNRWIWRCHIDLSEKDETLWNFLKPMIQQYDASVFSAPSFTQGLLHRQMLIPPSIDPLSDKNKELPQRTIDEVLSRFKIDAERPIVTQISRFDYFKDPVGVIEAYKLVKQYVNCQLVLAGGSADDDPEGVKVLTEVRQKAGEDTDIHILCLPPTSHIEINALQRASTVVLQKSLKEGFGLTVSEALWKGKPVIASAVGGIPLQITHKYSGILTHSIEGTAYWLKQLLQNPEYAKKLGDNGREQVRNNFLLTRHLREYMLLFLSLDHPNETLIYL
ncbi:MAG: glycosyltransferase [Elusimicrobia bacterium]|nr:glycosyltransferase [Elusimicrobiota bacterium]